ncbi:hypothetical protein K435DRAFT_786190 [Dendrothele bispora CBS 962.96]|uniref:Uncharacterized protein n=1 Tax=Dendrothele bispora (strain CBS 962.96) TaxID=1314807 RepID=A0A4S8KS33_DENBC|nr:hypothetical protein K435DRAFT_786190 [Dendrothele bispora CBS 962.96]
MPEGRPGGVRGMLRAFSAVLLVAGGTLYLSKRIMENKRKADLEIYKTLQRSEGKNIQNTTQKS